MGSHPHAETLVSDGGRVPSLVGDIYDAAIDTSRWTSVLKKSADFIGGSAALIFFKDARAKGGFVSYHGGELDPHYQERYVDTYQALDPTTPGHVLAEIERPMGVTDILPYDEFMETRIYREWGRPQGLVDLASAVLDKSAGGAALFGVYRQERHGLVDDDTRWRMRQIVPHIRRAMMIGRAIELKTYEAATLADTLDGLSAGMFLVDAAGRIVHANASGHTMLSVSDVLRSANGRLVARETKPDRALHQAFLLAGNGDAAVGSKGISVPLTARDGEHYAAHVLPLTCGARRRAGATYSAAAAVFVHKAELAAQSPPEAMAKAFDLTPSELRVLLAVVQVGGVAETAEALGVAASTIKTHLQRLFGKTGTSRQSDLIKLVAGFANPLVAQAEL